MAKKILQSLLVIAALVLVATLAEAQETQQSILTRSQKFDHEGVELYSSNYELKSYKKIGLGVSTGGLTGLLGFNVEVNVASSDAVIFGLGTGTAYNSFQISWKRNFEAAYLSPYIKAGYSTWFNSNAKKSGADDSSVLKSVLSDSQIKENRFAAHFLAGGAGLEYNQLEGELSGVNFYGELFMLGEIQTNKYLPTAGVGLTYFY